MANGGSNWAYSGPPGGGGLLGPGSGWALGPPPSPGPRMTQLGLPPGLGGPSASPFQPFIGTQPREPGVWGKNDDILDGAAGFPGLSPGPYMPQPRDIPGLVNRVTMGLGRFGSPMVRGNAVDMGRFMLAYLKSYMQGKSEMARINLENFRFKALQTAQTQAEESAEYGQAYDLYGTTKTQKGEPTTLYNEIERIARKHNDDEVTRMLHQRGVEWVTKLLASRDAHGTDLKKMNEQLRNQLLQLQIREHQRAAALAGVEAHPDRPVKGGIPAAGAVTGGAAADAADAADTEDDTAGTGGDGAGAADGDGGGGAGLPDIPPPPGLLRMQQQQGVAPATDQGMAAPRAEAPQAEAQPTQVAEADTGDKGPQVAPTQRGPGGGPLSFTGVAQAAEPPPQTGGVTTIPEQFPDRRGDRQATAQPAQPARPPSPPWVRQAPRPEYPKGGQSGPVAPLPRQPDRPDIGLTGAQIDQYARQMESTGQLPAALRGGRGAISDLLHAQAAVVAYRASQREKYFDDVLAHVVPGADQSETLRLIGIADPDMARTVQAVDRGKVQLPVTGYGANSRHWYRVSNFVFGIDPNFDNTRFTLNLRTKQAFQTGWLAQQNIATIRALEHANLLADLSYALKNSNYPLVNSIVNRFRREFGDPSVTNFQSAVGHVASELTRAFRGTGGAEADIQRELNLLGANASPDQILGFLGTTARLLEGQLDGFAILYNRGTHEGFRAEDFLKDENHQPTTASRAFDRLMQIPVGTETHITSGTDWAQQNSLNGPSGGRNIPPDVAAAADWYWLHQNDPNAAAVADVLRKWGLL